MNEYPIQREYLRKGNLQKNKFNFPMHNKVESMCDGAVSDRTPYDIGMEQEHHYQK